MCVCVCVCVCMCVCVCVRVCVCVIVHLECTVCCIIPKGTTTHLFDCDVFTGEGVSSGGDQLQIFGVGGVLQCEYLMGRAA